MINYLSIIWDVDPIMFSIGTLSVNWYSALFVFGFFPVGYFMMRYFYKREGIPIDILDPLLWALLLGTVLGARLGHIIFYDLLYYLANPVNIFLTWEGGLASHGGAIGVLLAMWWYVRRYGKKYGFDFFWMLDRLVIPISFVSCFIRLGNLMNSEIYGNPTDLPWGFVFSLRAETVAKHPTQLYEVLAYLILGIVLLFLYRRYLPRLKRGTIFGIFMIIFSTARILIEFIKEPQSSFEVDMFLNMGQILSIPFLLVGVLLVFWSVKNGKPAGLMVINTKKEKVKTELKYSKPKK